MIRYHSLLAQRTFWLEPPASTSAQNHDLVFYALLYVMAFFFFLVVTIMLAFVVLYRRRKGQLPTPAPRTTRRWRFSGPSSRWAIVIGFFVVGLRYYVDLESPPAGADVVDVEASQWQFNFKYPNGAESNELYLLVDRPVVLKLTSKDVTHALYIPAFRVQRNAVPGRNTEIWFKPTELTGGPRHRRGGFLSRLLHAVLRQRPRRNEYQGVCAEQGGLQQEAGRGGQHLR